MGVRVFAFGCLSPRVGGDLLVEQLRLAHDYYDALIDVERARRDQYRQRCDMQSEELREIALQIEACQALIVDVRHDAGQDRIRARSRTGADPQRGETVAWAVESLRGLWDRRTDLITAERERDESFRADIASIDRHAHVQAKRLYAEFGAKGRGLYWGTQNEVIRSIEQARKSSAPPRRRQARPDEGAVTVQLQKRQGAYVTVADVFSGASQFAQIDPVPERAHDPTVRLGERRRLWRTVARIRIGSSGRAPTWVEVPVVIHRQMPLAAEVRYAKLVVWREATTTRYELQLTVNEAPVVAREPTPATTVGVDLGWRWQDSIRVAYMWSGSGRHAPVTMSNEVVGAIEHAASLRSIRDRNMDEAKSRLRAWLAERGTPEWMRERVASLHAWRAPGKLAALVLAWRGSRVEGDEEIFAALEEWRKQDRHLWQWEHNEARKARARRIDEYRVWAARLADAHTCVCIEDFDLRKVARREMPEERGEWDDMARAQRVLVAPGRLREILVNACRSRGVRVVTVPAKGTTTTCHECGRKTKWDAARYLSHRCECGAVWDQDANAARNILARGLEKLLESDAADDKTERQGRWQRRKEASSAGAAP